LYSSGINTVQTRGILLFWKDPEAKGLKSGSEWLTTSIIDFMKRSSTGLSLI